MSGSIIRLDTQMKVFKIGVMLTLLHACKTWTDVLHFDHHPQAFDILRKHVMNIARKEALPRLKVADEYGTQRVRTPRKRKDCDTPC